MRFALRLAERDHAAFHVAEWTAIDKWANWAADLPVTKVNCSDGDVPPSIM